MTKPSSAVAFFTWKLMILMCVCNNTLPTWPELNRFVRLNMNKGKTDSLSHLHRWCIMAVPVGMKSKSCLASVCCLLYTTAFEGTACWRTDCCPSVCLWRAELNVSKSSRFLTIWAKISDISHSNEYKYGATYPRTLCQQCLWFMNEEKRFYSDRSLTDSVSFD